MTEIAIKLFNDLRMGLSKIDNIDFEWSKVNLNDQRHGSAGNFPSLSVHGNSVVFRW